MVFHWYACYILCSLYIWCPTVLYTTSIFLQSRKPLSRFRSKSVLKFMYVTQGPYINHVTQVMQGKSPYSSFLLSPPSSPGLTLFMDDPKSNMLFSKCSIFVNYLLKEGVKELVFFLLIFGPHKKCICSIILQMITLTSRVLLP